MIDPFRGSEQVMVPRPFSRYQSGAFMEAAAMAIVWATLSRLERNAESASGQPATRLPGRGCDRTSDTRWVGSHFWGDRNFYVDIH